MTARWIAAVLVGVTVGAAAAAPAQALRDRDAAMQFSFAAYRARIALLAQKPEIQRRFDALNNDTRCVSAIRHAPKRARSRLGQVFAIGLVDALIVPLRPALDTFRTDLGDVVTTDPALRSGRAAWRLVIDMYDALPDLGDVCATLDAWRRTGYDPAQAPPTGLSVLRRFANLDEHKLQRRLNAAGRRMRQLGVLRRDAHRFTGDPMFRGLDPEDTSTGSGSAGPPPV